MVICTSLGLKAEPSAATPTAESVTRANNVAALFRSRHPDAQVGIGEEGGRALLRIEGTLRPSTNSAMDRYQHARSQNDKVTERTAAAEISGAVVAQERETLGIDPIEEVRVKDSSHIGAILERYVNG